MMNENMKNMEINDEVNENRTYFTVFFCDMGECGSCSWTKYHEKKRNPLEGTSCMDCCCSPYIESKGWMPTEKVVRHWNISRYYDFENKKFPEFIHFE